MWVQQNSYINFDFEIWVKDQLLKNNTWFQAGKADEALVDDLMSILKVFKFLIISLISVSSIKDINITKYSTLSKKYSQKCLKISQVDDLNLISILKVFKFLQYHSNVNITN